MFLPSKILSDKPFLCRAAVFSVFLWRKGSQLGFAVCLVRLSPKRQEQKILGSLPLFVNIKLCTFGSHLASLGFSVLREKGEMDAKILQMLNTEYECA